MSASDVRTSAASEVRILRVRDVCERIGVGRSKLYELFAAGELRRVRLGARAIGVRSDDLAHWIESRVTVK